MGKIKKILENELVGGTQNTDVYPVTSIKAVYDENNERLDHILNRRGVVNISTNYNADHTAEVLTLSQAIAKVPSSDRVLGFQGEYLASDGWHTVVYTGEYLTTWSNNNNWIDFPNEIFKSISKNATFAGIATPTTNPGIPDGPVFYLAPGPGIYYNFNGIEVADKEVAIIQWCNSAWTRLDISLALYSQDLPYITNSDNYEFGISDDNGNVIASINNGHLRTKNFNSEAAPYITNSDNYEFGISDDNGNVIASINNGHLRTKNFNSKYSNPIIKQDYADNECINAFIMAMQKKADKLGMSITVVSPSGATGDQISDGQSMAKLFLIASGYSAISNVWNQADDITIYSKGSINKSHLLHSSVYSYNDGAHYANNLLDYYPLLGGKTGSWGAIGLLGGIIPGPNGELLACWLRRTVIDTSSKNRFTSMKILVDIAYAKLANPDADITALQERLIDDNVQSAQVYKIPSAGNVLSYETFNFIGSAYDIYSYNNTYKAIVASNIKVLTIITALDHLDSNNSLITIKQSDLIGGSGATPEFVAGEQFTVQEIMLSMMMPSSNSGATALARHVGNILLNERYGGMK